jgi:alpha-tubulin suppressor-like RCC1 family protein
MFRSSSLVLVVAAAMLVAGCKKNKSVPAAEGSATTTAAGPASAAAPPPASAPSTQIALAEDTIFYKSADGSVKVLGSDDLNTTGDFRDQPTAAPDLSGTARLGTSDGGGMCAAMKDGSAKCWGDNSVGQLGTGKGANSKKPVTIPGVSGAVEVDIAGGHACALISDGSLTCWGNNEWRQSGPTTADILKPTAVAGVTGVAKIAVSSTTACALGKDGSLKCWGLNCNAPALSDCDKPFTEANLAGATDIGAGHDFICVVTKDSGVSCFGHDNQSGQFGDGTTEVNDGKFTSVKGLTGARLVVGASSHACALMKDRTVQCWGYDEHGELGDGTVPAADAKDKFRATPAPVKGLTDVAALSCSDDTCCAQLTDASVKCWGENVSSQLFGSANDSTDSIATPVAVAVQ